MLNKWFQKYVAGMDDLFEKLSARLNKPKGRYDQFAKLVSDIRPELFYRVNRKENALTTIVSQCSNIASLNRRLTEVNFWLDTEKIIYSQWGFEDGVKVTVPNFFLSEKQTYIDEVAAMEDFREGASLFIALYEKCSQVSVGPSEHNFRIANKFMRTLEETVRSLHLLQSS